MASRPYLLAMALMMSACTTVASASGLKIAPIIVQLDEQNSVRTVRIENEGDISTRIQLRVFEWGHAHGQETLTPTRDVLVNPGMFEIAPNSAQTIRIGRVIGIGPVERSYRLLIDEIPPPERDNRQQVKVLLRISTPIFVSPTDAKADLHWELLAKDSRQLIVSVQNKGAAHSKITSIYLGSGIGAGVHGRFEGLFYVLPQSTRTIVIPLTSPVKIGQSVRITAKTNDDDFAADTIVKAGHNGEMAP